jgi:hypothetical protein
LNVFNVPYFVALENKIALHQIVKNRGLVVSNVKVIVNSRAAGIDSYNAFLQGPEFLLFFPKGIEKDCCHGKNKPEKIYKAQWNPKPILRAIADIDSWLSAEDQGAQKRKNKLSGNTLMLFPQGMKRPVPKEPSFLNGSTQL